MSAGRGIQHSEMNASDTEPVHFIQMWVPPDTPGIEPGYEQRDMNDLLDRGGLVPIASGKGHPDAIRIHQAATAMHVARLRPEERVTLPDAPFLHVFVAKGNVARGEYLLGAGDEVRLRDAGAIEVQAHDASEIIVWESDQEVQR